jgi:uncharacterized repeat protein (TIGR03803 family)
VFALSTDGTGFTNLYSFSATSGSPPHANSNGANPGSFYATADNLTLSGNTLYGTTFQGGGSGKGTVFAVNTDGTGFTNLHSFTGGSDGAYPSASLGLSGKTLYGTAGGGGPSSARGTVFKINTDGTGFTTLHTFTRSTAGVTLTAPVVLSGDTLYGTTYTDVISPWGTVFKVNTDGTGFIRLHSFTGIAGVPPYINDGGAYPFGGVILSGNTLYGMTAAGSSSGLGTLFSISLPVSPPQLAIKRSDANHILILTWPTNAIGFQLESATDFAANNAWATVTDPIVVVGDQNVVTNVVTVEAGNSSKFFRLKKP